MQIEKKIKKLSQSVIDFYFFKHDYFAILSYLSKTFTWMGIGKEEVLVDKELILPLLQKEGGINQVEYRLIDEKYRVEVINDSMVYVLITLLVEDMNNEVNRSLYYIRSTHIWIKEEIWKLKHVHDSLPAIGFQKDEYLNLNILHKTYQQEKIQDPLTRIHNLQGFEEVAQTLIVNPPYYVMVVIGIKNFRSINKKYGYAIGDDLLKEIAYRLQRFIHKKEVCGRIEKDTFSLILVNKGINVLKRRLEQLEKEFDNFQNTRNIKIHFRVGIYSIEEEDSIKESIDKALLAMKKNDVKHIGTSYALYDKQMNQQDILLEAAMLAMEEEEFELYIQPQFDIKTQKIVAGEALVRWIRNEEIYQMPNDFIPLFEEYRIILTFDFYMLDKLCWQIKEWMKQGINIAPISINQSRLHIEEEDYFKRFLEVVDAYEIPHHYFAFELTESIFVENTEKMTTLAKQLHLHHFQLAIDDFGTGYAALNVLSVVSADILKIDKTLIQDYKKNEKVKIIMEKIIEMAHMLDMVVICEGVETREQLEFLDKIGCDIIQGYLLGRPIKAKEFANKWLKEKEGVDV